MPVLRLLVAGLVAAIAIGATLFAGAIVVFTGLVGLVLQFFRRKSATIPANSAPSRRRRGPDDAIDVVATKVGE